LRSARQRVGVVCEGKMILARYARAGSRLTRSGLGCRRLPLYWGAFARVCCNDEGLSLLGERQ